MTASDLEEPRMIWTGPLPPHLTRAEEPSEAAWLDPHAETTRRVPQPALTATAAGVALIVGIAIGAFVPPLLRPGAAPASRPPAEAQAPVPAVAQLAEPPAPTAAEASVPHLQPAAPAPRAAVALLAPPPIARRAVPITAPTTKPCESGSRAERTVCEDAQVAAADRDLKQAYQRALAAGAPAETLHEDQIEWLLTREDAARRSPADLALAYRQRIDQVNSLADEPPH